MGEFLTFRKMVTPIFIQLLFWLGVLGAIGTGIFMMTLGDNLILGVAVLFLGPIAVRIYAELLIVIFRIQSSLNELVKLQKEARGGLTGQPAASSPSGGWQTSHAANPAPAPSGPPSGPPPSGPPSA